MDQILDLLNVVQTQKETVVAYAKFIGVLVFGFLLVSSLFRFIFGKKAQLNHAVSAAVEILCLYVINIVIYSLGLHWKVFLSPLPFMSIEGDSLHIMPVLSTDFSLVCEQVLKVVIIAFLDPIIGALYTFFFSNIIGRNLAKALVTTALVTALMALLEQLELTTIFIAASGLTAYIPLLVIVLVLWYIIGHIL